MPERDATSCFNHIYEATKKHILICITAKCGNTEDINDIFQDTYADLYSVLVKRGAAYIENPEAFVTELAKRRIFKHYSLRSRMAHIIPMYYGNENEELDFADESELSLEEAAITKETVARINERLKTKDETSKKIFYLYYYMEQTIADIAKELKLNESTVKSKLYRLRAELRELYQKGDDAL